MRETWLSLMFDQALLTSGSMSDVMRAYHRLHVVGRHSAKVASDPLKTSDIASRSPANAQLFSIICMYRAHGQKKN